jgi:hypothetical protein
VHPRDLLLTHDVRRLAGNITRGTLLYWRRHKGFPEPIRAIRVGSKHRSQTVDIYDRRDVRAWLKAHPASGDVKPNRR